jgi:hypothetical protein
MNCWFVAEYTTIDFRSLHFSLSVAMQNSMDLWRNRNIISNWRNMMLIPAERACENKMSLPNSPLVEFFVKYLNEVFIVRFHHIMEDISKTIKNWRFRVRVDCISSRHRPIQIRKDMNPDDLPRDFYSIDSHFTTIG